MKVEFIRPCRYQAVEIILPQLKIPERGCAHQPLDSPGAPPPSLALGKFDRATGNDIPKYRSYAYDLDL